MNSAKLGKLDSRTKLSQLSWFCSFGNEASKPSENLAFNVLMNPGVHLIWVEPSYQYLLLVCCNCSNLIFSCDYTHCKTFKNIYFA